MAAPEFSYTNLKREDIFEGARLCNACGSVLTGRNRAPSALVVSSRTAALDLESVSVLADEKTMLSSSP